jgi:hypothetical protein
MLGILKPFQKLLQTPANDVDIQLKQSTKVASFEPLSNNFYSNPLNLNTSKKNLSFSKNKLT